MIVFLDPSDIGWVKIPGPQPLVRGRDRLVASERRGSDFAYEEIRLKPHFSFVLRCLACELRII